MNPRRQNRRSSIIFLQETAYYSRTSIFWEGSGAGAVGLYLHKPVNRTFDSPFPRSPSSRSLSQEPRGLRSSLALMADVSERRVGADEQLPN